MTTSVQIFLKSGRNLKRLKKESNKTMVSFCSFANSRIDLVGGEGGVLCHL